MSLVEIDIKANDLTGPGIASAVAQFKALQAALSGIGGNGGLRQAADDANALGLALENVASHADGLKTASNDAAAFTAAAGAASSAGYGLWGVLSKIGNTKFDLFSGILPGILGAVGGFHLLADAIIETSAVIIPASIAFGAFAVAAIPTVQSIYKQMQNLYTVTTAYGTSIYPLTGGFQKMAAAVQPQVYTLFGEALVLLNSKTGAFSTVAQQAGTVLDQLGARFVAAVTSGNGFNGFLKNAAADLGGLGTLIGNIGGIIGNLLKVMPGYAEVLLHVADGFTHIVESITGSGLVQTILGLGLAFHGAFVYIGLAATAGANLLTGWGKFPGLFGLMSKGLDAAAGFLTKFGAAGASAGKALSGLSSYIQTLAAMPWGWMLAAAAAVMLISQNLVKAHDSAAQFNDSIQKMLQNVPIMQLNEHLMSAQADTAQRLSAANQGLTGTLGLVRTAISEAGKALGLQSVNWLTGTKNADEYQAALGQIQTETSTYNSRLATLTKMFGGSTQAWALMNEAGITSKQMLDTNKTALAQIIVQMKAAQDAQNAMALGTGRNAAAMNALGNTFMTQTVPAIQKVTQAEDTLMNTILGGRQAFTSFEQSLLQMGTDANTSGANLSGLNKQSLTLASDFYTQSVPAAQKMISALQQQGVATNQLTPIVATAGKQLLSYAGNNTEAKSVIVSLINNALGPGTVSMQTLNSWVGKNSTTMQGFSADVAKATINASQLASTIKGDLNSAFSADLLQVTGANAALKVYTSDLANNTATTAAGRADRQQLIKDLENSGMSAKDATNWVNGATSSFNRNNSAANSDAGAARNLTGALKGIPESINPHITVTGTGSYYITGTGTVFPNARMPVPALTGATGGMVSGPGSKTSDSVPAALSRGEYVVQASAVDHYGKGTLDALNSRTLKLAGGGFVGVDAGIAGLGPWAQGEVQGTVNDLVAAVLQAMLSTMRGIENSMIAAMRAAGVKNIGVYDQGGWLPTGTSLVQNNTGAPEYVVGPNDGMNVQLSVDAGGASAFEQFMVTAIRQWVRVKGGGNVQKAFGR